jgi:hypothetical protein
MLSSRDMCISPALLDFLEQTLEPFDMIKTSFETASNMATPLNNNTNQATATNRTSQQNNTTTNNSAVFRRNYDTTTNNNNNNSSTQASSDTKDGKEIQKQAETASYFPVEVVVFVSMLPSCIRFTCLPQSTVECLLKLPTLELVFSTYKIDSHVQDKLYSRLSEGLGHGDMRGGGVGGASPPSPVPDFGVDNSIKTIEEGGLSVTCSMTDFSLKFYNRLALRNNSDNRFFYSDQSSRCFFLVNLFAKLLL